MSERKFKVGDRVIGIGRFDGYRIDDLYGTVLGEKSPCGNYPIEFDKNISGHTCNNRCKDGHGWYVAPNHLKLANEDWKVVIIPEGDKTLGRLYENGKVIKSVETTKHPDDEYSVEEACRVITDRMFKVELLDKFEEGKTYVFSEELHDIRLGASIWTKGLDGTVVKVISKREAEINGFSIVPEWCKEVKEAPKPTYYNGKVVCVDDYKGDTRFTVGKIYQFEDGLVIDDVGDTRSCIGERVTTLEEFHRKVTNAKFIEVVE